MIDQTEVYKKQFYQEARDILEKLNTDILKAESDPENADLLNSIFRGIHTIKGSAGVFDLVDLSQFTHGLEGVLTLVRDGKIHLDSEIVDLVFLGADAINDMIDKNELGEDAPVYDELSARFKNYLGEIKEIKTLPPLAKIPFSPKQIMRNLNLKGMPAELEIELNDSFRRGLNIYEVRANYPCDVFANGYDPAVFLKNLKGSSPVYKPITNADGVPLLNAIDPLTLYLKPLVYIASELSLADVEDIAFDPSLVQVRDLADTSEDGENADINEENLQEFLVGAADTLIHLEQLIMAYEANDKRASLDELFRIVHTVKGDADYIGLAGVTRFSHALESLLERVRSGGFNKHETVVEVMLKSLDFYKVVVRRLHDGEKTIPLPAVYNQLCNLAILPVETDDACGVAPVSEEMGAVFIGQAAHHREILAQMVRPLPLDAHRLKTVRRSLEGLQRAAAFVGSDLVSVLTAKALAALDTENEEMLAETTDEIAAILLGIEGGHQKLGDILVAEGKLSEKDVIDVLSRQKKFGTLVVESGKLSETDVLKALKKQELIDAGSRIQSNAVPLSAEPETRTMRVDEAKIDKFTNTIGELVVARNTLEYLLTGLASTPRISGALVKAMKENLYLFSRVTNEMQSGVISLRMIPIRGVFQKFTRVVRDISKKQEKLINFVTEGEEIEIDKKVADMLSDPLIHIVRNSCDHGLESPEERRAKGKKETGSLTLKASQEGSNLIIKIIDDGKGINRQGLFEKARKMGIKIASPDDDAILDLIFLPGLSTKNEVSDLSGRGVGMDVVKTTVKGLGGEVRVLSETDKGTEITLTLPMSMGIRVVLVVTCSAKTYAIPLEYVVETVKLKKSDLRRIHDRHGFYYRGEVLPAEGLERMLYGGDGGNNWKKSGDDEELQIVVLKNGAGKFGAVVDSFNKNLELAIKPVPEYLAHIDVISGVSILGDGRVVLVLNPEKIV